VHHTLHNDVKGGLGITLRRLAALGIGEAAEANQLPSHTQHSKTHNPAKRRGNRWRTLLRD